ncbi:MAG: GlxA family transcriptional regulator [Alcanivoracaceae bacterium]|nr:GlxA family transcriptional regulator [Alcanivoracaceae bacterium]
MKKICSIYFLVYDGIEMLDLSGPAGVFSTANHLAGKPLYDIKVVSINGGLITCSAGMKIDSCCIETVCLDEEDTLLVVGALEQPLRLAINKHKHRKFIRDAESRVKRIGSVCSGAFLLASAGILDGKSCTTHWQASSQLSGLYKSVKVMPDLLYVVDGNVWTSAGVTTGIDMALAMVEYDHDRALMGKIARQLVVYTHRPGNQSQFSSVLEMQIKSTVQFDDLINWVTNNLHKPLRVNQLADYVNMSERTFHRKFVKHFGKTPAKFVELLRLERAREYLTAGMQVKQVTIDVGFQSEAGFRSAFENYFGIAPSLHKKMNSTSH